MMKAIRITNGNKARLENDYALDKGELEISAGMYLVSGFGGSKDCTILTPARYKMQYDEKGDVKNGYVSIQPKSNSAAAR